MTVPIVKNGRFTMPCGNKHHVNSPEWFAFLNTIDRFVFEIGDYRINCRAESRKTSSNLYWSAYKKIAGKLHKKYLGQSEDITSVLLNQTLSYFRDISKGKRIIQLTIDDAIKEVTQSSYPTDTNQQTEAVDVYQEAMDLVEQYLKERRLSSTGRDYKAHMRFYEWMKQLQSKSNEKS